MTSQPVSRKRPAPGTSPVLRQPLATPSPATYSANTGSELSDDQFLQWGQNPSSGVAYPTSFADASSSDLSVYTSNQRSGLPTAATPTKQVACRANATQIVHRNHPTHASVTASIDRVGTDLNGWEESLEQLYQRAQAAKRDAHEKKKQIPPFVQKLSSFLDESKNTDLIRWSNDGNSFIVLDEDEFAKTLIPELFKHNNYASFVRQLNMYGFHKKVGLSDHSMRASERKNKSPSEYANPYFKRGHPDLLWLIQKPKSHVGQGSKSGKAVIRAKTEEGEENEADDYGDDGTTGRDERARPRGQLSLVHAGSFPKDQLADVYRELQAIRQQQQVISNTINKLRREHEQLYAQAANFQEQHNRHENSINAILTFLATVYNRSLQGDVAQNLANSFAGVISQDQGSFVDIGDDYSLNALGTNVSSPAPGLKKQPLLLKAPPGAPDRPNTRAATLSPSAVSLYDRPRGRSLSRQASISQSGHIEELFDQSPRTQNAASESNESLPRRDIMSVIHNTNARTGIPTSAAEFPNVLSSLENSGGNVPLTPNQRADMLRLMAHETSSTDPSVALSANNALVSPTPPPMPHNYNGRLASTRAEIDKLMKMQAEQDRSVQNLTNLLQPLSPTGTIPGLGPGAGHVAPPPLDLDQIFNNDYFTDMGDLDVKHEPLEFNDTVTADTSGAAEPQKTATADETNVKTNDTPDLFDFGNLSGEGDLFDDPNQPTPSFYAGFDGASDGQTLRFHTDLSHAKFGVGGSDGIDSGRIIENVTDSESNCPTNSADESRLQHITYRDSKPPGEKGNENSPKRRRKT